MCEIFVKLKGLMFYVYSACVRACVHACVRACVNCIPMQFTASVVLELECLSLPSCYKTRGVRMAVCEIDWIVQPLDKPGLLDTNCHIFFQPTKN